jgi:hypothetical protein
MTGFDHETLVAEFTDVPIDSLLSHSVRGEHVSVVSREDDDRIIGLAARL